MMKGIMKRNNVDSLEEMVRKAIDNGVKVIACIMSMELMGIKEEELIDGIEFAGATAFLEASENSDTNLFIS
jgi:peroxiredoxin family protein